MEADLVAHSGPTTSGSFVQTLVLTDIASGWTKCAPLLFREQQLLGEVMTVMRDVTPFPLLGFDTDNDTVFINETIKSWGEAAGVEFTRSRPYRKNDQAHIKQKNGAIVRRMVGYRRLEGLAAAEALARLYRPMRLFVNFFQPSFRLAEKRREGALAQALPSAADAASASGRGPSGPAGSEGRAARRTRLRAPAQRNPHRPTGVGGDRGQGLRDRCGGGGGRRRRADARHVLTSLRQAWKEGEVRPTVRRKPSRPRGRRRPDPLKEVAVELEAWFDADPGVTGRQLLDRLQAAHPGEHPDKLLRTMQRRLKVWRRERAKTLVLRPSSTASADPGFSGDALRYAEAPRIARETRAPGSMAGAGNAPAEAM